MTTKKICAFNHNFLCANHFIFKVIYIQGLLWKTQGLYKHIPQFFNIKDFSRT